MEATGGIQSHDTVALHNSFVKQYKLWIHMKLVESEPLQSLRISRFYANWQRLISNRAILSAYSLIHPNHPGPCVQHI